MDGSRKEVLKYVLARGVFQCLGRPNAAATSLCGLWELFPPGSGKEDGVERVGCLLFHAFQKGHAVEGTSAGDW